MKQVLSTVDTKKSIKEFATKGSFSYGKPIAPEPFYDGLPCTAMTIEEATDAKLSEMLTKDVCDPFHSSSSAEVCTHTHSLIRWSH
jgi:hypothetical protein